MKLDLSKPGEKLGNKDNDQTRILFTFFSSTSFRNKKGTGISSSNTYVTFMIFRL